MFLTNSNLGLKDIASGNESIEERADVEQSHHADFATIVSGDSEVSLLARTIVSV